VLSFLVFAGWRGGEPNYCSRAGFALDSFQGGDGAGDTWADYVEDSRARFSTCCSPGRCRESWAARCMRAN